MNDKELYTHIGSRLKQIRKAHNLTLDKISSIYDVSPQQVQKYETGATHISPANLYIFLKHFNINLEIFLSGSEERFNQELYESLH